jgi:hypothetical protein
MFRTMVSLFLWRPVSSPVSRNSLAVRRKSWLYLVSLGEVHPLRELINDPHVPTQEMIKEVKKFNPRKSLDSLLSPRTRIPS